MSRRTTASRGKKGRGIAILMSHHMPCHTRQDRKSKLSHALGFYSIKKSPTVAFVPTEVPSVLVVEDDPDLRYIFRVALMVAGFRVREAGDGYMALAALEDTMPDVIVLDLGLPRVSGFLVLDEIAARQDTSGLSVIVVTGLDVAERHNTTYLRKPVEANLLVHTVRGALRRRTSGVSTA
jgi:CheY-like chemotaxis protein